MRSKCHLEVDFRPTASLSCRTQTVRGIPTAWGWRTLNECPPERKNKVGSWFFKLIFWNWNQFFVQNGKTRTKEFPEIISPVCCSGVAHMTTECSQSWAKTGARRPSLMTGWIATITSTDLFRQSSETNQTTKIEMSFRIPPPWHQSRQIAVEFVSGIWYLVKSSIV